jgi:penicillin-binding protein 1A
VARSLLLSSEKTYIRKIKEALLAYRMEANLSKEEILFLYLNQIYLGQGAYGIEAASRVYFRKPAKDLSVPEAALLAATPRPATP